LVSQVSGQNRFPTHPSAAATAKKMTAVGMISLMSKAQATRSPPRWADSPAIPHADTEQHELTDPDGDFAQDHHGKTGNRGAGRFP
jgi:hypothetical protein